MDGWMRNNNSGTVEAHNKCLKSTHFPLEAPETLSEIQLQQHCGCCFSTQELQVTTWTFKEVQEMS